VENVANYEYPLNERTRSFLRLEFLFKQISHFLDDDSSWSSRAALASLVEIQEVVARSDLKTEILKELERHSSSLNRLKQQSGIDQSRLEEILSHLERLIKEIYDNNKPFGHQLKSNDFLIAIRQRVVIPGGMCDFDLPVYHHWLNNTPQQRIDMIKEWLAVYDLLSEAVHLILKLIRESTLHHQEIAEEGIYQKTLDSNSPCQLVRIALPADSKYFPEVSGGKHRVSIRFMSSEDVSIKAKQTHDDVVFKIAYCII
jgi:cell division protein ZapD